MNPYTHRSDRPGEPPELDATDELELDTGDDDLGVRLRTLLDPSSDLRDRTSFDVERRLRGRSVLAMGFELLGLGAVTVRTLLSDDPATADQVSERDRNERS